MFTQVSRMIEIPYTCLPSRARWTSMMASARWSGRPLAVGGSPRRWSLPMTRMFMGSVGGGGGLIGLAVGAGFAAGVGVGVGVAVADGLSVSSVAVWLSQVRARLKMMPAATSGMMISAAISTLKAVRLPFAGPADGAASPLLSGSGRESMNGRYHQRSSERTTAAGRFFVLARVLVHEAAGVPGSIRVTVVPLLGL